MNVPLTRGYVALIDAQDAERVGQFNWATLVTKSGVYAYCSKVKMLLHRFVLSENDPAVAVDHEDRDGLNCQHKNLRRTNQSNNLANSKKRVGDNPYKGVFRLKTTITERWMAYITVNYKRTHLGMFPTAESAARAYDSAAREAFGSFARLNFPE